MTVTARPGRTQPPGDGALRRGLAGVAVVLAGLAAGAVATLAGPYGRIALVGLAGCAVLVIAAVAGREHLPLLLPGGLLADTPSPGARRDPSPRPSRVAGLFLVLVAGGVAGVFAFLAGSFGLKAVALVVVLAAATTFVVLYRRELGLVLFGIGAEAAPAWVPEPLFDLDRRGRRHQPRPQVSKPLALLLSVTAIGAAVVIAWLAATLRFKGILGVVGLIGLTVFFVYLKPRADMVLFMVPCSLVLFLHKSFTEFQLVNSGAPAVYLTSLGLITIALYGMWVAEGTFVADVKATLRRPIVWAPLVGALLMLPSMLVASNLTLGVAELVRMAWMYALFVYLAARVRRQSQILVVVLGLALFALVELVVVLLQWKTGGVLGLGFLGVPTELGERVVDNAAIGRPFGTIVHPVFLGATMGALSLLFLALGLHARDRALKIALLVMVPLSAAPIVVAQSRAALAAYAPVAVGVVLVAGVQGRIPPRALKRLILAGLVIGIALFPTLKAKYYDNFGTSQFSLEVESRVQLNDQAIEMIADHPLVGVGLNNYQQAQPRYDDYGLLFAGNPVHNLYLLQVAETGYVGLIGLLVVGGGLLVVSLRLARERDPLFSGLGTAMTAIIAFFTLEELLGFSLRQEIPLALWWLLAGIVVAASAMAAEQRRPRRTETIRVGPLEPQHHVRSDRSTGRDLVSSGQGLPANGNGNGNGHRPLASAGRPPSDPGVGRGGPGRRRRPPRRLVTGALVVAIVAGLTSFASPSGATNTSELSIVFAATDRTTGDSQGIYVATGDGAVVTRVTPDNGAHYDFPQWAMGGTKIVYSMRLGPFGAPQNIYMMNPDGSGVQALTTSPWRNDQPKVAPDGRTAIFTRFVPGTRLTAIFEIDLATLLTTSLSAVHSRSITADADPRFANGGHNIVFARSRDDVGEAKTQAYMMNRDGTGYTRLTQDDWYDVDPALSPDGTELAVSSYQGPGEPRDDAFPLQAKQQDFHLLVRNLASGTDRNLTAGANCSLRHPEDPCDPAEGSAYTPLWTPDGSAIGYVSALDSLHVCICVMGTDGSDPRRVIAVPGLSVSYFDWTIPTAAPPGAVTTVGLDAPEDRLLVTGAAVASESDPTTTPFLRATTRDLWNQVELPVPAGLAPRFARWSRDRSTMVFSAVVPGPVPPPRDPPAPPPGERRSEHFTLDLLQRLFDPPVERPDVAREQVYIATPDGLRQLTDPYIEDWNDGLVAGDARGNTEPDLSPDGRYVVMTNVSSITNESFILRLDLQTGEIYNLSNATTGALPTDDAQPRFSADGSKIAFTTSVAGRPQIMVMDAADGRNVRAITTDDHFNVAPAWSPDGSKIVYASFRGGDLDLLQSLLLPAELRTLPRHDWYLVEVEVSTGIQTVLTLPEDSPALAPVYSPDGSQIAFISVTDQLQPDVYVIDTVAGSRPRPALITVLDQEYSVDWK